MKRFIAFLLTSCLLLSSCSTSGERIKTPVTFFYLQSELGYFSENGVIASEIREASGHATELSYLLALYLMGPSDESLTSPLPENCQLYYTEEMEETLILRISDLDNDFSDYDFSLACACLALTCFGITEAQNVTIYSGDRILEMNRHDISLYDSYSAVEEPK